MVKMSVNDKDPKVLQDPIIKFRQISYRTFAHATESLESVEKALQHLFPFELIEKYMTVEHLTGSFGNPIRSIVITLNSRKVIEPALTQLGEKLSIEDKKNLEKQFTERLDEKHKFYLRLDKQQAVFENASLANSSDVIQIILAVQNKTPYTPMTEDHIRNLFSKFDLLPTSET